MLEEDPQPEEEPPNSGWFLLFFLFWFVFIPLLFFYPFKTIFGTITLYCMRVGYLDEKHRAERRRQNRR